MDKETNLIPIWQPIGYSTHIITSKVSEKYGVKTSHTGTLDPMAEGVILVLLDEDRNKKYELAKTKKGYEFEIVVGLSTDTFDSLGITSNNIISKKTFDIAKLKQSIKAFIGEYTQTIPPYSAIKVKGKPMHWYARNNKLNTIEIPKRTGTIYKLELLETKDVFISNLIPKIIQNIKKTTGDLRQEEIISNWNKILKENENEKVQIIKFYVEVSKGIYVRSLSYDICQTQGVNGFTRKIVRTKNGTYTKQNSKTLEELFGNDFRDKYDFVSRSMP